MAWKGPLVQSEYDSHSGRNTTQFMLSATVTTASLKTYFAFGKHQPENSVEESKWLSSHKHRMKYY